MKVTEWTARLGFLHPSDSPGGLPDGTETTYSGLYRIALTSWTPGSPPAAWQPQAKSWIEAFDSRLRSVKRQGRLSRLELDSYFGQGQLTQLYPAEVKWNRTS